MGCSFSSIVKLLPPQASPVISFEQGEAQSPRFGGGCWFITSGEGGDRQSGEQRLLPMRLSFSSVELDGSLFSPPGLPP